MTAVLAGSLHAGASAAQEAPALPIGQVSVFSGSPAPGLLVLPPAADARPLGVVVVLHDSLGPDPRSARYIDQLLGARIGVIEPQSMHRDPASLPALLAGLAADARTQGLRIGVLGFGAGGRLAARMRGDAIARALMYPGCESLPALEAEPGDAVLLAHGDADPANATQDCIEALAPAGRAGAAVRHLVYPQAGYAWDYPAYGLEQRILLPNPGGAGRAAVEPWPELTAISATHVAAFFVRAFGVAP